MLQCLTCLTIRGTKCGKTQMNYVLRVNNTNIFRSITLRKVQLLQRSPPGELKKMHKRQDSYLGTIAKFPIEAPGMDQVILKVNRPLKNNYPKGRSSQSREKEGGGGTLLKQGENRQFCS